jgi:hypothetical protein
MSRPHPNHFRTLTKDTGQQTNLPTAQTNPDTHLNIGVPAIHLHTTGDTGLYFSQMLGRFV